METSKRRQAENTGSGDDIVQTAWFLQHLSESGSSRSSDYELHSHSSDYGSRHSSSESGSSHTSHYESGSNYSSDGGYDGGDSSSLIAELAADANYLASS